MANETDKKLLIQVNQHCHFDIDLYNVFDGKTLDESLVKLKEEIERFKSALMESITSGNKLSTVPDLYKFNVSGGYYDEPPEIEVLMYKWETDEEFKARIEKNNKIRNAKRVYAKKKKEEQHKKDIENWKALMKKYGTDINNPKI